jgi:quercetin dioxygenase-like cupin family protein
MRKTLILTSILAVGIVMGALGHHLLSAQPAVSPIAVASSGLHSTIKSEQVLAGYLKDVNGKYKLRVGEVTFDPNGYIGEHQHRGPGIRHLAAGEITLVQEGKTTVYKAGDYWFEPGDITNAVSNKGTGPATIVQFELLPADVTGSSSFVPLK